MNWKSLFVKEEDKPQVQAEAKQQQPTVVPMYGAAPAVVHTPQMPINASQDYNQLIEKALEENNQEGFDYFEFRGAIKAFDGKPIPDAQKYEYAFMPLSALKVTPNSLVTSANFYKGVLQAMQSDFEHQVNESFDSDVTKKEAQIAQMQKQIEELTTQCAKLASEAQTSKYQLDTEKQAFGYAHAAKMQEIDTHIKNIQTYLNATPQQQPK